jgi:hypothetical protein
MYEDETSFSVTHTVILPPQYHPSESFQQLIDTQRQIMNTGGLFSKGLVA